MVFTFVIHKSGYSPTPHLLRVARPRVPPASKPTVKEMKNGRTQLKKCSHGDRSTIDRAPAFCDFRKEEMLPHSHPAHRKKCQNKI